jgi:hypothetical protein
MSNILVLAFASALYPILLGMVVIMLAAPKPVPLMRGYLLGGAVMSIGIGIAILYLLQSTDWFAGGSSRNAGPVTDIVLGAVALLTALALAKGWDVALRERRKERHPPSAPKAPKGESWSQKMLARGTPRATIFLGMVLSLPSFYYLAALKEIEQQWGTSATAILVILGFNVIQFLLIEVPLVLFSVAPERTRVGVDDFNRWLRTNKRRLGMYTAAGIGVYLVIRGVAALVS